MPWNEDYVKTPRTDKELVKIFKEFYQEFLDNSLLPYWKRHLRRLIKVMYFNDKL